jgi:prophage regulatory protein
LERIIPHGTRTGRAPLDAGEAPRARLERFLLLRQVEDATGLKRAAIYEKMKRGEFPRQIRLTGKVGAKQFRAAWVESEVIEWQRAQIRRRDEMAEAGFAPSIPARLLPAAQKRAQEARERVRRRRKAAQSEIEA